MILILHLQFSFLEPPILLATWCKEPTHWKRPWCWERLRAEGEGGWDGCMASPTQWTWSWANSGRWWRAEKPGVLQSMGSQTVRHELATEQQKFSFKVNVVFKVSFFSILNILWYIPSSIWKKYPEGGKHGIRLHGQTWLLQGSTWIYWQLKLMSEGLSWWPSG